MHHLLVALLVVASFAFPTVSFACTPLTDSAIGGSWGELIPHKGNSVPLNFRILHASARSDVGEYIEWKIWRGDELVDLVLDEESSYEYGSGINGSAKVWRAAQTLRVGDVVGNGSCCLKHVLGAPDHTPPPRLSLSVVGYYASTPFDDCGPMRHGELVLDAGIPRVEELSLLAMIYVGETASEAREATRISHIRRAHEYQGDFTIKMYLHAKGLASPTRPFCVAVELEDTAGNRSPRSEALCFENLEQMYSTGNGANVDADPQPMMGDENAPDSISRDDEVDAPGCATLSLSSTGPDFIWALLALFAALQRRRQTNSSARSSRGG